MTTETDKAFADGVLNLTKHKRLVADIDRLVALAGIETKFVLTPLAKYCNPKEVAWIKTIRSRKSGGLVLGGEDTEIRMSAMTGALMRNFIDGRMMTLHDVLFRCKEHEMPTPTVLLIPNFFVPQSEGGKIPMWQTSLLVDMLLGRKGKKTILGISDIKLLEKEYGKVLRKFIEAHFDTL